MTAALKKIPPKIWFFLFSVLFLVTSILQLPGAGAETQQADIDRYSRDNVKLEKAIVYYHKDMNDLFDANIKELLSLEPDDKRADPPPEGEACDSKNVSTYCVALRAVDKFNAFQSALLLTHLPYYMDQLEEDLDSAEEREDEIDGEAAEERVVTYRVDEAVEEFTYRQNLIAEQLEIAELAMDKTLMAYNEIFLFYQLHVEYNQLITDLEAYRDELAKVRNVVESYPSKFHNRTTTDCT